jgi:hypothetical protein
LGLIYYYANKIELSDEMFQNALDSNRNRENKRFKAYCNFFLGNNFLRKKNPKMAIDKYKLANQCDSSNSYLHYNLAAALLKVDSLSAYTEFNIAHVLNNNLINPISLFKKYDPKKIASFEAKNEKQDIANYPDTSNLAFERTQKFIEKEKSTNLLRNLLGYGKDATLEDRSKIKECILNGADVSAQNPNNGWTGLHHAAYFNDTILLKKMLSNKSVNINAKDLKKHATPLFYAVGRNNFEAAKLLLEYGNVEVDAVIYGYPYPWENVTALDAAVQSNKQMIQLLLQYNAHKIDDLHRKRK